MSRSGDVLTDEQSNSTFKKLRERTDSADHHLIDALADRIDELEDRARHAEQKCDRLLDAVENERAMLRAVIDQMPAGVIVVDALSGRLVLDNEQVNRILQHHYLPAAEAQKLFGEVGFHPDGRPYGHDEWPISRSIATGERVTNEEIAFLRADGSAGHMEVSVAPVTCSGGAPRFGVAVFSDITERKRAERELRTSRDKLALALDAIQAGVSFWDFEKNRTEWNPRQFELLGYAPGSVEPGHAALVDRLHHEDRERVLAELERSIREREDFVMDYRVRLPGGEVRWIHSIRRFAYDAAGQAVSSHGIMYDITDRKHHEAIRQQAYDQIEHNMELFAILGDHVRHPLQVIMARADLLGDAEAAASIREQVQRINTLVKQLDQGWVESRAIREFLRRNDLA